MKLTSSFSRYSSIATPMPTISDEAWRRTDYSHIDWDSAGHLVEAELQFQAFDVNPWIVMCNLDDTTQWVVTRLVEVLRLVANGNRCG